MDFNLLAQTDGNPDHHRENDSVVERIGQFLDMLETVEAGYPRYYTTFFSAIRAGWLNHMDMIKEVADKMRFWEEAFFPVFTPLKSAERELGTKISFTPLFVPKSILGEITAAEKNISSLSQLVTFTVFNNCVPQTRQGGMAAKVYLDWLDERRRLNPDVLELPPMYFISGLLMELEGGINGDYRFDRVVSSDEVFEAILVNPKGHEVNVRVDFEVFRLNTRRVEEITEGGRFTWDNVNKTFDEKD